MTVARFLKSVAYLFDANHRRVDNEKRAVKKALKRLRRRKLHLKDKLAEAKGAKQEIKLKSQIAVVRKQRERGVALLKRLRRS